MNYTVITLAVVAIVGLTKLLTWLLGDKRRLRKLQREIYDLEEDLRIALSIGDTVWISDIRVNLERLRREIKSINAK